MSWIDTDFAFFGRFLPSLTETLDAANWKVSKVTIENWNFLTTEEPFELFLWEDNKFKWIRNSDPAC